MREFSIVAIVAVITAVFTTTVLMSLTVQSAQAVCSARNPSVCADPSNGGQGPKANTQNSKAIHVGAVTTASGKWGLTGSNGGAFFIGICRLTAVNGVMKNGKTLCVL